MVPATAADAADATAFEFAFFGFLAARESFGSGGRSYALISVSNEPFHRLFANFDRWRIGADTATATPRNRTGSAVTFLAQFPRAKARLTFIAVVTGRSVWISGSGAFTHVEVATQPVFAKTDTGITDFVGGHADAVVAAAFVADPRARFSKVDGAAQRDASTVHALLAEAAGCRPFTRFTLISECAAYLVDTPQGQMTAVTRILTLAANRLGVGL